MIQQSAPRLVRPVSMALCLLLLTVLGAWPASAQGVPCLGGFAGPYACDNVDLLAIVPSGEIVAGSANPSSGADMWGWTDPETGREYAIQALSDAVAFVDVTDPTLPTFVGHMPAPVTNFLWRDLKVYANKVYVVGDFSPLPTPSLQGTHGLQVFDLTRLRGAGPLAVFTEDHHYTGFDEAHNIAINEETGLGAVVASDTCGAEYHLLDLNKDPSDPDFFIGCFNSGVPGATHDAQCTIYRGPDPDHQGKEICLSFNEDRIAIIDMSDKSGPKSQLTGPSVLSIRDYEGRSYAHQGWLTEDHAYMASNDETDELDATTAGVPHNTHTYLWDVRDLDAPVHIGTYVGPTGAIDHNHYFNGRFLHQANYTAGYRVLDAADIANANLTQIAFFDTVPPDVDAAVFGGSWSGYFFFESGVVAVSNLEGGELFVLRPHLPDDDGDDDEAADKTTGGGWLADADGGKINFGFNAKQKDDRPQGSLQLNDKGAGVKIHLDQVTLIRSVEGACGAILAGPNALEFRGTGRFNRDIAASFRVCVGDNGEPGNSGSTLTPDRFHLECVAGCSYSTGDRVADDALDGGNIQVHRAPDEPATGGGAAATLILDPVLLDAGQTGAVELFQVRVFDGAQEPLAGAAVSLERTSGAGSAGIFSAVTDPAGIAALPVTHLGEPAEYVATVGAVESNAVTVQPLTP